MRFLTKVALLGGAVYGAKWAYDKYIAGAPDTSASAGSPTLRAAGGRVGYDTPTGTDPDAKYERPGYEDKSFGQAVDQDAELVDRLMEESGGDAEQAAMRFRSVSAGAPALERQEDRPSPQQT